jgi:hypothetical protein
VADPVRLIPRNTHPGSLPLAKWKKRPKTKEGKTGIVGNPMRSGVKKVVPLISKAYVMVADSRNGNRRSGSWDSADFPFQVLKRVVLSRSSSPRIEGSDRALAPRGRRTNGSHEDLSLGSGSEMAREGRRARRGEETG